VPFGTIGVAKQKGGSVGSSGRHNDRTRETPNADPERTAENRVLIGSDRNVREAVTEMIEAHGGKPRRDSVEAVELLLSASHEYFEDADPEQARAKLERFTEQAVAFLSDRRNCGVCVKAVLHLDERTPHVHAHMVPIDPKGRLNAKYFLGGREKMKTLHDRYAEYMSPLGLERGREGSRARHQTVKQFYASVEKEVELKIDAERVPDPPRFILTAEAARKYKQSVLAAILKQLKEPLQTLQHQAMLTKDERAHRVETERRADERMAAVRQAARAQVAEIERRAAEHYATLERSAHALLDENRELRGANSRLQIERTGLIKELVAERVQRGIFQAEAQELGTRLRDIPLVEVMQRLGYGQGELQGQSHIYRDTQGDVAMTIAGQEAFDHQQRLICRNSIDLVQRLRIVEGRTDFTKEQALTWLRAEFGAQRAAAAYVVNREQSAFDLFERQERARAQTLTRLSPTHERDGARQSPGLDRNQREFGIRMRRKNPFSVR
jgi:hypothetical protein